jgi:TonB family protein
MPMKLHSLVATFILLPAALLAQGSHFTPLTLVSADLEPAPWNVQSAGITAFDVSVDASGAVTGVETVQDLAPYAAMMRDALPRWRFQPARRRGSPVATHVLVLGFFRPPAMFIVAPDRPRYKDTEAPDDVPWPTAVTPPPYPPNATGSGKVILEVDVADDGTVSKVRVVSPASVFDGAASDSARAWKFRPSSYHNRDVGSRLYLLFSFIGITP